jgi:hypothetical protein
MAWWWLCERLKHVANNTVKYINKTGVLDGKVVI